MFACSRCTQVLISGNSSEENLSDESQRKKKLFTGQNETNRRYKFLEIHRTIFLSVQRFENQRTHFFSLNLKKKPFAINKNILAVV